MLPVLGLYAEIYARRHGTCAAAYATLSKKKAELFPATFEYVHRSGLETSSSTQVLFGDLVAAVEQTIDNEGAGAASKSLEGAFAPGTNAQRHRLHHAKHGSKHGSAHASGRLSMANIFGSSGSTLSSGHSSGSVEAPAPAEPSDRPRLARSLTWRATPPALPKEPSSSQV